MIERSFQLLPGIGPWRERDLWSRGLLDWGAFRAAPHLSGLPARQAESLAARIAEAEAALAYRDLACLAALLPAALVPGVGVPCPEPGARVAADAADAAAGAAA